MEEKQETIVIGEDERLKFLSFGELDKAWQELLFQTNSDTVRARKNINIDVNVFWQEISKKYKLSNHKNFRINPATGEITETVLPTKETLKEGETNE